MGWGTAVRTGRIRRLSVVLVAALAFEVVPSDLAAAGQDPPDELLPPAPGEGDYLEDPSDPAPNELSVQAYPQASFRPGVTTRWRRPTVTRRAGHNRFQTAAALSRAGWGKGSRTAVLTRGHGWGRLAAATTLAGVTSSPLLLTGAGGLPPATAKALRRLGARKVFAVGVPRRARRQLARMGITVEGVGGRGGYAKAFSAARRAIELGANQRTVVVASGRAPKRSLGAGALVAGKRYPLLLVNPRSTGARLRRQVKALGATHVLVVGGRSIVPRRVVKGLRVRRLWGTHGARIAASAARVARRRGLDGRVTVVGRRTAEAMAAGVFAGARRDGPVLLTGRKQLPAATMNWLAEDDPRRAVAVGGRKLVGPMPVCQLRRGRARPWRCIEAELRRQGYQVGRVNGRMSRLTVWALYAFEKVNGRKPNGHFTEGDWRALMRAKRPKVRRKDLPRNHTEIHVAKQLIYLVRKGKVRWIFHTSTGKPSTPIVRGTFTVYEKRPYYQPWNAMYKAIFFYGGYAIHGYPKIPLYPASHGCARTYNGNQDFLYPKIKMGERVAVY